MIVHPDLRALWGDDTPQRVAQETLVSEVGAWYKRPHVAGLLAELETLNADGPLADCPMLGALFDPDDCSARELAEEVVGLVAQGLDRQPLGHAPFRHFTDDTLSTLLLARSGNVTLALVAIDGQGLAARPEPVTADFSANEVWEHVLSGTARAELVERVFTVEDEAVLGRTPMRLAPGTVVCRDATREMLLPREVDGCLVSLRLQRRRVNAGPTREYRLSDGKFVHQAAGNPRDSRIELMLALLCRMQRKDAAPILAEMAKEDGSMALRWQALRECLALDTSTGFAALSTIARSESDDLAVPAGALRSQLIETYPQLKELDACPANLMSPTNG